MFVISSRQQETKGFPKSQWLNYFLASHHFLSSSFKPIPKTRRGADWEKQAIKHQKHSFIWTNHVFVSMVITKTALDKVTREQRHCHCALTETRSENFISKFYTNLLHTIRTFQMLRSLLGKKIILSNTSLEAAAVHCINAYWWNFSYKR